MNTIKPAGDVLNRRAGHGPATPILPLSIPARLSGGAVRQCGLRSGLSDSIRNSCCPPARLHSAASPQARPQTMTPPCLSSWKNTGQRPLRSACSTRHSRSLKRDGSDSSEPSNSKFPTFCGGGLKDLELGLPEPCSEFASEAA